MCSICFAQEHDAKDSIQICYRVGADGIGGYDHCVTLYAEDSLMYCKRVCYSKIVNMRKYMDVEFELSHYEESKNQALLRHYQESSDYLILDERVEINKSQFDEFIRIIDEIKMYASERKSDTDEIIISTGGMSDYVIKDKSGTIVISGVLGYNRRGDIEKTLGLESYLRCPCVEKDLKQMENNKKKNPAKRRRIKH